MHLLQLNPLQAKSQHVKSALNAVVIITVTLAASYFITSDKMYKFNLQSFFSPQQNQVQLADLTDAQVDMIIAVKNTMHEAKIQHD